MAALEYDVDNRLKRWTGAAGDEFYGYLADNKRVWKKTPGGVETYYLYGLGGQKLMTCSVVASPFALNCAMTHVYFGGKVIRADGEAVVQDRLGSVVARGGMKRDYFPYGDEIGGATAGNVDKFGTYMRDQTTGLDYADQRYYAGNMSGRFLTADPYEASGGAAEPSSWNRYPYVGGDPVNSNDPQGLKCVQVSSGGRVQWADDGAGGGCDKAGVNGDGSMTSHKINVAADINAIIMSNSRAYLGGGQTWAGMASLEAQPPDMVEVAYLDPIPYLDLDRELREREECYRNAAEKNEEQRRGLHEWVEEEFRDLKSAGGSATKWALWGAKQGFKGELSAMVGYAVRGAAGALLGGFVGGTLALGGGIIAGPVLDPILRVVANAAVDNVLDLSLTIANSHCGGAPLMPTVP
jgi:RHS repeat-associated protein